LKTTLSHDQYRYIDQSETNSFYHRVGLKFNRIKSQIAHFNVEYSQVKVGVKSPARGFGQLLVSRIRTSAYGRLYLPIRLFWTLSWHQRTHCLLLEATSKHFTFYRLMRCFQPTQRNQRN